MGCSNQEVVQIGRRGFRSRSRSVQRVSRTSQSQPTRASSPCVMPQHERVSLQLQVGFQQQSDSSVTQGGLASSRVSTLGRSTVAAQQQQHVTRRRDIGFEHWSSPRPFASPLRRIMGGATTTMMPPVLAGQWDTSSKDVLSSSLSTQAMRVKVTPSTRGCVVTDSIQQSAETVQPLSCPRRQHLNPNMFQKCSSEEPLRVQVQSQMVMCAQ